MDKVNQESNPWKVLRSSTVYENRWIAVEHNEILDASGREGVYGIVRYAHASVATLAVSNDGRICLVGQYRLPHLTYAWELPGGGAAPSEDLQDAAQRELQEEAGWGATDWLPLPVLHPSNAVTDEVVFPFLAWTLYQVNRRADTTELISVNWVPLWQAVQQVENGEIRDATTVAIVLRVALMATKTKLPDAVAQAIFNSSNVSLADTAR